MLPNYLSASPLSLAGPGQPPFSLMPGGPGDLLLPATLAAVLGPGTRSTSEVLRLLTPLHLSQTAMNRLFAPFPVPAVATYGPDPGPGPSVDIAAAPGAPVIVPADGTAHLQPGSAPGQFTATVTAGDGTVYTLAHLDGFAPALVDGQHVSSGDALGTVGGSSGPGDPPHMHFEVRPGGGAPDNPVPTLDAWLGRVLQTVRTMTDPKARAAAAFNGARKGAAQASTASAASPLTLIPGLIMVGVIGWVLVTYWLRRRRGEEDDGLTVESTGSTVLIRPPLSGLRAGTRWLRVLSDLRQRGTNGDDN